MLILGDLVIQSTTGITGSNSPTGSNHYQASNYNFMINIFLFFSFLFHLLFFFLPQFHFLFCPLFLPYCYSSFSFTSSPEVQTVNHVIAEAVYFRMSKHRQPYGMGSQSPEIENSNWTSNPKGLHTPYRLGFVHNTGGLFAFSQTISNSASKCQR